MLSKIKVAMNSVTVQKGVLHWKSNLLGQRICKARMDGKTH